MRFGDHVIGALVALIGLALTLAGWPLPDLPGQGYGASTFPVAIGIALMALGAGLFAKRVAAGGEPAVALTDWGGVARSWLRLTATLLLVVLYILFADRLGFLLAGTALLFALLLTFGAPTLLSVALAPVTTLVVAWAFGNVLRVPLPRGVLSGLW